MESCQFFPCAAQATLCRLLYLKGATFKIVRLLHVAVVSCMCTKTCKTLTLKNLKQGFNGSVAVFVDEARTQ